MIFKIVLIIFLIGCNSDLIKNEPKTEKIIQEKSVRKKSSRIYCIENDTLIQQIIISDREKSNIQFEYSIRNKKNDYKVKFSGIANNKNLNSDPEIDEDENGYAYPSIQYEYQNKDCLIVIRREMLKKDKIQIYANGCEVNQRICPIESIGILRLSPPR